MKKFFALLLMLPLVILVVFAIWSAAERVIKDPGYAIFVGAVVLVVILYNVGSSILQKNK